VVQGQECRSAGETAGVELVVHDHDLEGIIAKRLDDPYEPRARWLKIKNPDYSQKEGRGELLNRRSKSAF